MITKKKKKKEKRLRPKLVYTGIKEINSFFVFLFSFLENTLSYIYIYIYIYIFLCNKKNFIFQNLFFIFRIFS